MWKCILSTAGIQNTKLRGDSKVCFTLKLAIKKPPQNHLKNKAKLKRFLIKINLIQLLFYNFFCQKQDKCIEISKNYLFLKMKPGKLQGITVLKISWY